MTVALYLPADRPGRRRTFTLVLIGRCVGSWVSWGFDGLRRRPSRPIRARPAAAP
jgi:hypothetical protein